MTTDLPISLFATLDSTEGHEPYMGLYGNWNSPDYHESTQESQFETLNDFWLDLRRGLWPRIQEPELSATVHAMRAGAQWATQHPHHPEFRRLVHQHMLYLSFGRAVLQVDLARGRLRLPGLRDDLTLTAMSDPIPAAAWVPGTTWVGGLVSVSYCQRNMMDVGDLELRVLPIGQQAIEQQLCWGTHYV